MDIIRNAGPRRQENRRWSVGIVLAVAIALMLAVPLAHRALGQGGGIGGGTAPGAHAGSGQPSSYPGCGIAPWTGTCTCMLTPNGTSMAFEAFERTVRDPNVRPRVKNVDSVLTTARRDCRMPETPTPR
jgi:hypothetical protein